MNTLIQGDCLIEMKQIPDKSIDMILCDLPYGSTACQNTNRNYILIEKEEEYINIINQRLGLPNKK